MFGIVGPTKINVEVSLNSDGGMHVVVTDHKSQKKQMWKLDR